MQTDGALFKRHGSASFCQRRRCSMASMAVAVPTAIISMSCATRKKSSPAVGVPRHAYLGFYGPESKIARQRLGEHPFLALALRLAAVALFREAR
jgi:hypothetical protein